MIRDMVVGCFCGKLVRSRWRGYSWFVVRYWWIRRIIYHICYSTMHPSLFWWFER